MNTPHSTSPQTTIRIFDTTLRDGEQSPGITLDPVEKLEIALQLERLGVDVIEAGFPVASQGDFDAVHLIASSLVTPSVTALSRTHRADIDKAAAAIKPAKHPRLHVFIATSKLHMEKKLRMTPNQVLTEAAQAVAYAKQLVDDVEFSPEDGYRSDPEFMLQVCQAAVESGASTINIPDTVGFAVPDDYAQLIKMVVDNVPSHIVVSTHCHDDLGLAVANSLAGVRAGARQVECSINGLGERAGNAALEEVVMALVTRSDYYGHTTNITTPQLTATSRLVSRLTGYSVQRNKAIVGANAFSHESGIHQHGVLADKNTYEVVDAAAVGQQAAQMVLGKHSGRHAFADRLAELGFSTQGDELNQAFSAFKNLADVGDVSDDDLVRLVSTPITTSDRFSLASCMVNGGNGEYQATVQLLEGEHSITTTATAPGVIEAVGRAVVEAVRWDPQLVDYHVSSLGSGRDALAQVVVQLINDSQQVSGRGIDTDVVTASAKAYLAALNRLARAQPRFRPTGP